MDGNIEEVLAPLRQAVKEQVTVTLIFTFDVCRLVTLGF